MSASAGCAPGDFFCSVGEGLGGVVANVAADVFSQMAEAVTEAVGQSVAALGTLWVGIGTPVLSTNPGTGTPSDAVGFLQTNLYTLTLALAVLAILVGAGRTAWERRGEPLIGLLMALVTFVVVSGAGLAVIALLVTASDALAQALIDRSVTGGFGDNMTALIAGATVTTGVLTPLVLIVLGGAALLMSFVQIVLMVARGGMLVILAGIFPTAAAFTNTAMGRQWFTKCVAWLIAFILYKPAAAIVYAAAFRLTGTDVFSDDGTGLIDLITGLTLMLLALVALPALMRFVTPMVGAMTSGGGGTAALAAAALPTGAIMAGKALANRAANNNGGGKNSSSAGGRGSTGPSGSDGPSGAGPSGGGSTGPKSAKGAKSTGGEQAPSPAAAGAKAPAGAGAGAPATASAGAGGAGAASGAGAAGGAAAGGAAAAAGPVGVGIAAAAKGAEIADKGRRAAAQAGRDAADSATGEGGGPSGSR